MHGTRKQEIIVKEGGFIEEEFKWKDWNRNKRIQALKDMDEKAKKYGDSYAFDSTWHDYGGGKRGTPEETQAWLEYIADSDIRFGNAIYAFMVTMIFDLSWFKI